MQKVSGQKSAREHLYPQITPNDHWVMSVGGGHEIYVEEVGNPDGIPVVVLHGGPGGGCSPFMRQFFDPTRYRVILFDQRGCGKSRPYASVEANTTWHLLDDIEHIRTKLGIEKWMLFGGSWGATLALTYAQAYPERVLHIILRGVFLGTQAELDWFYGGGAGRFWPELWDEFASMVSPNERGDLIDAYRKRLFSGDHAQEVAFAQAWAGWETALASAKSSGVAGRAPAEYARAFSRIENHYFSNKCFFPHDDYLIANLDKIAQVPGTIVQGRLDMICPPATASRLHANWRASRLHMIPMAGHAMSEPGITQRLVQTMDRLALGWM